MVSRVENWLPPNPLLVGEPGASRFLPPVCIGCFRERVLGTVASHSRNMVVMFALLAMFFMTGGLLSGEREGYALAVLLALLSAIFGVDHIANLRTEARVCERALFFFYIKTSTPVRIGFAFWVLIGVGMGVTQLVLQRFTGGVTELFHAYGVMYPAARSGEAWRLMSGPFLHYNAVHYFSNLALLVSFGTLAWSLERSGSIAVFMVGNVAGAYAQMTWGEQVFNNYGGVSAGVFAMLGFVLALNVLRQGALPRGFGLLVAGITLVCWLAPALLSPSAASVAHSAGLAVGLAGAVGLCRFRRHVGARAL